MAEENEEQGEESGEATKSKGGKKKLIVMLLVGLALIGLSIGGTLFALQMLNPEEPAIAAEGEEGVEGEEVVEEPKRNSAIYFPLKPPIIVNFQARGRQRFLQAELTLMARENEVIEAVEMHMPMIRNSLVMLFGGQVYEDMQTAEGKELLRQEALTEVQRLLEQETGNPGVEQVLFTNFVMQ